MGKKVNQASVKISKDEKKQQQQFNSLIKVLRPKVYITDRSSFKKLVQELTGNGRSSSTTLSPPTLEEPNVVENYPFIGTDQFQFQNSDPESSTSVDASVSSTEATSNSSSELSYDALMNELEFNQVCDQLCLDDSVFQDSSVANYQPPLDQLLAYQNLESLLFDVEEPNDIPFYNCYEQILEQPDVSIYDYELSGLL